MMNLKPNRAKMMSEGKKLKPNFATFYNLGTEVSDYLDPVRTFREVGANLGMNHRMVQTVQYVALGKVVYRMREFLNTEVRK